MLKRILAIATLLFSIGCNLIAASSASDSKVEQPNIVLLFVDDWGWADLGYRNPKFESPNMDKLASESLDFQQAYIACPTCSPSRATLVTGKHPARLEIVRHIPGGKDFPEFDKFGRTDERYNLWPKDPAQFPCLNWLELEHTTYAEALKDLGYYNLFVGKWHLGHEEFHPIHQGFDKQIGTSNFGAPNAGYYPPYFNHTEVFKDEKEAYLTDKLTDETVNFIENYDLDNPFMISLWYYSVHSPFDGRKDLVEHFKKQGLEGKDAHYAAMVKSVDISVGRVRDALKTKGIEKETILILLSDQGGAFQNGPFHGGKYEDTLYEGGARVPFMINWPGVTHANTTNNSVVQSTDIFPTLVEIAGGDPSQFEDLDGVSLLSTIQKNSELQRSEPIYGYRAYQDLYASVREGDWKLLAYRSGKTKFYNIAKDPGETNDLAREFPEKVEKLVSKLKNWEVEMNVEKYSGFQ